MMLDTSSPAFVAAVAASVAAAGAAACTYHWTTSQPRGGGGGGGGGGDVGDVGDGNAGGLAGYARQLRAGSGERAEDSDTPFIADVWLQGGQPVSDGPDSTTFKFKFAKGDMPTGRKPDTGRPKPPKATPTAEL